MKVVTKSLMILTITLSFASSAMATAPTCKYAGRSSSSIRSMKNNAEAAPAPKSTQQQSTATAGK